MSKVIDLKEKRLKNTKSFIMKGIFIITVIYIIYAIYLIFKTPNDTLTVSSGILTEDEMVTGIIIRDEKVVQGKNYKNGIYQILSEGERAAKNQIIFRYYGKSEAKLQDKIAEVNLKIQDALEKNEKSIFSVADAKNLENQINKIADSLNNEHDIQKIADSKKNLSNLVLKKATIIGESSKSGSYIKKLISERENYEKELEKGSEYMKAPTSGIASYRVDGFEEVLGVNNLENLKSEELEKLDIKTGKIISSSNESGKVIDNFGCYIATILNSRVANDAEKGDKVKITLSSGKEVNAEVYQINQEKDKRLIILKLNTITDELISYRKISFNITWWSYSGIKIPNEAIIDEDGLKYVMSKTTTGTNKVLVKVLKKNENYSIVGTYSADDLKKLGLDMEKYKGISVHDTILMYPENK